VGTAGVPTRVALEVGDWSDQGKVGWSVQGRGRKNIKHGSAENKSLGEKDG